MLKPCGANTEVFTAGESRPNNTVILYLLPIFLSESACVILGPLLQIGIEGIAPWHFCLAREQTIQMEPRSHLCPKRPSC